MKKLLLCFENEKILLCENNFVSIVGIMKIIGYGCL